MATHPPATIKPRDRFFYTAMAVVAASLVFAGFARTYYLRHLSRTPRSSRCSISMGSCSRLGWFSCSRKSHWSPPNARTFIDAWALRAACSLRSWSWSARSSRSTRPGASSRRMRRIPCASW